MTSLPFHAIAGGEAPKTWKANHGNLVPAPAMGCTQGAASDFNMIEAFEPTPINPRAILPPSEQHHQQTQPSPHSLQQQYAALQQQQQLQQNRQFALNSALTAAQQQQQAFPFDTNMAMLNAAAAAQRNAANLQLSLLMQQQQQQQQVQQQSMYSMPMNYQVMPAANNFAAYAAAAAAGGMSSPFATGTTHLPTTTTLNGPSAAMTTTTTTNHHHPVGAVEKMAIEKTLNTPKSHHNKTNNNKTKNSSLSNKAPTATTKKTKQVCTNLDRLTQKLKGALEQLKNHPTTPSNLSEDAALSLKRKPAPLLLSKQQQQEQEEEVSMDDDVDCDGVMDDFSDDDDDDDEEEGHRCMPPTKKQKRLSTHHYSENDTNNDMSPSSSSSSRSNTKWTEMFQLLVQFSKREGHCNVYRYHEEDGQKLGMWLCRQRLYQKKGGLSADRIRHLGQVGVVWSISHAEKMMNLMYQYKCREGNCEVPRFHVEDGMKLGMWLQDQKQQRKRNNLNDERIHRLDQLGIVWDIHDDRWEKMYNIWCNYIKRTGHSNVPRSYVENGQKLGMWLHTQRKFKKRGTMNEKRSALLEEAGIVWDVLKQCQKKAYTNGMYRDANGRAQRKCEDL